MALLIGAGGYHPYIYYSNLRLVVCGMLAVDAYVIWQGAPKLRPAAWTAIAGAILFNPLAPVYLTREIWRPIDLVTAGVLVVLALLAIQVARRAEASRV